MVTIAMWISGVLLLVGSVIPGWKDATGRPVPYQERWSTGDGFLCLGLGVGLIFLGAMIFSGRPLVRHMLMGGIVAIGLSGFVQSEYKEVPLGFLILVALIAIVMGVRYLYFRPDVVRFFTQNQEAEQTMDVNRP